jgi:hypothetical protein
MEKQIRHLAEAVRERYPWLHDILWDIMDDRKYNDHKIPNPSRERTVHFGDYNHLSIKVQYYPDIDDFYVDDSALYDYEVEQERKNKEMMDDIAALIEAGGATKQELKQLYYKYDR